MLSSRSPSYVYVYCMCTSIACSRLLLACVFFMYESFTCLLLLYVCVFCVNTRWFLTTFYLVLLGPSWFPRSKRILLWKAEIKCYLWASFHDFWPLLKSTKSDIEKAISAKQIMIWKLFLCKNKHYNVVVLVPNFHLPARSSSFFLAFFLHVNGEPF